MTHWAILQNWKSLTLACLIHSMCNVHVMGGDDAPNLSDDDCVVDASPTSVAMRCSKPMGAMVRSLERRRAVPKMMATSGKLGACKVNVGWGMGSATSGGNEWRTGRFVVRHD